MGALEQKLRFLETKLCFLRLFTPIYTINTYISISKFIYFYFTRFKKNKIILFTLFYPSLFSIIPIILVYFI
jgi:hypothetical protein